MTSLTGRVFSRALGAFAALSLATVAVLAAVAVQGQDADAPTDSDCDDAWTSSSASDSCGEDNSTYYINAVSPSVDTSSYIAVASNNQCRVEVDCLKSDTTVAPVSNVFSGSTDQVKSLHNCEGTLKEPSC